MYNQLGAAKDHAPDPQWYQDTLKYEKPVLRKSVAQIFSSLGIYVLLWVIMVGMINLSYPLWLVLILGVVAALFLVRMFIIFHDCTHNSFFVSRKANRIWGYVMGLFTLAPYERWQHAHNIHHNTYADLDHRGVGDVWTLTVDEYLKLPWGTKLVYRLYRNPVIMLGIGPAYVFIWDHRFCPKGSGAKERFSVHFNNLALLIFVGILAVLKVSLIYFLLYMYVLFIAGIVGVWLFYVQHQFEGVYWSRHDKWDPLKAAFEGSSYYQLPKILQWLSGNIGLHPIHHLRVHIPNYNLQQCYDETPALHTLKKLSFRRSLKSLWLNLWDEREQRLVSFHALKTRPPE